MKRCPVCKTEKPETEFSKNKSAYDGLQGHCKICQNKKLAEYRKKVVEEDRFCSRCNQTKPFTEFPKKRKTIEEGWTCLSCRKIHKAEYMKEFNEKNREERLEYLKNYRKTHKVNRSQESREYNNQQRREKYQNDPEFKEKQKEQSSLYRKNNPEKVKESSKTWIENNKEDVREYHRNYQKEKRRTDPEFHQRELDAKKHYRYKNFIPKGGIEEKLYEVSQTHLRRLFKWQMNRCYICNVPFDTTNGKSTIEHIIPRSMGGLHSPENIVLSCESCNFSRQHRLWGLEWEPEKIHILEDWYIDYEKPYEYLKSIGMPVEKKFQDCLTVGTEHQKNIYLLSSFSLSERNPHLNGLKLQTHILEDDPDAILIFDFEWYGDRREGVINALWSKIHQTPYKMGARKLKVQTICPDQSAEFLNHHHIMGKGKGNIHIGLLDDSDFLWGVGVFQKLESMYDCVRLAFHGHVPGGMSKIFTFLRESEENLPIISFVDSRYASGEGHEAVGFRKLENSRPSHWWINGAIVRHQRHLSNPNKQERNLFFYKKEVPSDLLIKANGFFRLPKPHLYKIRWD